MKAFYVYMMTNQSRVVLYTGITNSLVRRVWQHQNAEIDGFTKAYKVNRLVYDECFDDSRDAIAREEEIKGWRRAKKNATSRNEESEVRGLIADALSAFQTFIACFGSHRWTTMIQGNSAFLRGLRGPSLRSG
jgi:putative endonuclease